MNSRLADFWRSFALAIAITAFTIASPGQRAAVVVPDDDPTAIAYAERLDNALSRESVKMVDRDAARSAFKSQAVDTPFNMSAEDAARAGATIGTDAYILIKGANQRRSSFEFPVYHEASAAVYVVSSRTGQLGFWRLQLSQGATPQAALAGLVTAPDELASLVAEAIRKMIRNDVAPKKNRAPELPAEGTPQTDGLRPPMPYRRIKPVYTPEAYLFDITATVDIEVEIDAEGQVTDTEIVRWAGYGLDESVTKTVREMNWRPADRAGKTLPMRVLLRYNFKKAESDETEN